MAPRTIISSQPFQSPAGVVLASGKLVFDLSQAATITGSGGQVAPSRVSMSLDSGGLIINDGSQNLLWGNDQLTPNGTIYNVSYFNSNGLQVAGPLEFQIAANDLSTIIPLTSGPQVNLVTTANVQVLNSILFADQFTSIQAAINALPSTGGWIFIKPGTYVGPTSIPSHVHLTGYVNGLPAATMNAATNLVFGTVPADQKIIFTYTAALTLSTMYDTTIENITFDFGGGNFGLILGANCSNNIFDICIQNTGSSPCLTFHAVTGNGQKTNEFRRLYCFNGFEGIQFNGTNTSPVGNNIFNNVYINNCTNGLDFVQQCDTNSFNFVFIGGLPNTGTAVVFNSTGTPLADVDANDNVIRHLVTDVFNLGSYSGTLIKINQSNGNVIQSWTVGGGITGGGGTNITIQGTPSYIVGYATDFSTAANSNTIIYGSGTNNLVTRINTGAGGVQLDTTSTALPGIAFSKLGVLKFNVAVDGSNVFNVNDGTNVMFRINSGAPVNSLVIPAAGGHSSQNEILTAAAPTVAAGQVGIGATTAASATAGANGAVPAQVAGYLVINVAGTVQKIPYFNT